MKRGKMQSSALGYETHPSNPWQGGVFVNESVL